jgi:4-hydroxy-2-oxoheptanedioate aldolase
MLRPNPVKARLREGRKCLGLWLVSNNALAAEMVAQAGFDFVIIDHEHGPGDLMGVIGQQHALRATAPDGGPSGGPPGGPAVFLRAPWNDPVYIKRALDTGVEGIMVPYVETADEARAAIEACKYPPAGSRGCAIGAIHATGFGFERKDYWQRINDEVTVIVQIETPRAIDNIPEIAEVEGVDVLFIGPTDLSVTGGFDPTAASPEARALIERAEAAIQATGIPMATVPYHGMGPQDMFDRGYALAVQNSDLTLIRNAGRAMVEPHRKANG